MIFVVGKNLITTLVFLISLLGPYNLQLIKTGFEPRPPACPGNRQVPVIAGKNCTTRLVFLILLGPYR